MTAKVIRLNQTNFHNFIDKLTKAYDEDRLEDLICIFSDKYAEGEDVEGFSASVRNYWFSGEGGSSLHSLGLVELMKTEILNYYYEAQV